MSPSEFTTGDVNAIAEGRHPDPFAVLGPHRIGDRLSFRVFAPHANDVQVLLDGGRALDLKRLDGRGVFAGDAPAGETKLFYKLRLRRGGSHWTEEDPYRFPPILGEMDLHLIAEGKHLELYKKLGAHPCELEGVQGTAFAVWAPNARRVSVVGHFNSWDGRRHPMRKRHEAGVWEIFLPSADEGALYKFEIAGPDGQLVPLKADPIAFRQEAPPAQGSLVQGLPRHRWGDWEWMEKRGDRQGRSAPISIYEVHFGSWRRGDGNRTLSYDELADQLIPYAAGLGFTHIELLPITEHPFTGSWGYQPIGLYAPTSRFGPPEAFARFVDRCHQAGLGVLMDWVPAHFPSDTYGLARFDGTALYEHEDPRLGLHKDWNTLIYNLGRREVANFLEANAEFWLEHYHADGLRVDAVASMLYLDYSRESGEWVPNVHGGNENLESIAFLRAMNAHAYAAHPGAVTIAEESTAWPKVSRPLYDGGLGFGYKWNMGWMHDTLGYMSRDPIHRRHHHNELTFGLIYAFNENFVLPLSHDEVVHGKKSLIGRMPGDRWQRFANLRAYFGFMWTHPGKKLLFMGGEFAQLDEWNHDRSLDWHLLADGYHRGVQTLIGDLNRLYRESKALHELDCEPEGFQWVDGGNSEQSVFSYLRKGRSPGDVALAVCNFTPTVHRRFRVGVPFGGCWLERINTDAAIYGGSDAGNSGAVDARNVPMHGQKYSLELTLPPLATVVLQPGRS